MSKIQHFPTVSASAEPERNDLLTFCDNVSLRLAQVQALMGTTEAQYFEGIVAGIAPERRDAADLVLRVLSVLSREIDGTKAMVDSAQHVELRPMVSLAARPTHVDDNDWQATLSTSRAVESSDVGHLSGGDYDTLLRPSFARAIVQYEAARAAANNCKADGDPEHEALFAAYGESELRLMLRQAETPAELKAKVGIAFDRELFMEKSWPLMRSGIEADLSRAARQEPSQATRQAFSTWRSALINQARSAEVDDDRMSDHHTDALRALMRTPASCSGDHLVKAYVQLQGALGGCSDGNMFDPNTEFLIHGNLDHDEEYYAGLYADLEACDLGNCLLTFGRTHFRAGDWLDRATALGMKVRRVPLNDEEEDRPLVDVETAQLDDPQLAREQARLLRLFAYDDRRVNLVAELIQERAEGAEDHSAQKAA